VPRHTVVSKPHCQAGIKDYQLLPALPDKLMRKHSGSTCCQPGLHSAYQQTQHIFTRDAACCACLDRVQYKVWHMLPTCCSRTCSDRDCCARLGSCCRCSSASCTSCEDWEALRRDSSAAAAGAQRSA
jgi:hypothetical protein